MQRQPAGPPLPRSAHSKIGQLQPNDRGVRQNPFAAILRKQRQCLRPIVPVLQHLDRLAPSQFLRAVDLAEIQNVLLNDTPTGDTLVLDNAPVAMFLAVLPANLVAQKHAGADLSANRPPWKYPRSALQPFSAALPHRTPTGSMPCRIEIGENR